MAREDTFISKIVAPNAFQILAQDIKQRILAGDIPEGTTLPNERELSLRSGLSRTSVREAIRMLEVEGLIEIKTGRKGGSIVRRPGPEVLLNSLNLFIWGQNISTRELLETRTSIEPPAAGLAAIYRSESDLQQLEWIGSEMSASLEDTGSFLDLNRAWHLQVVKASHNTLIIQFYSAIIEEIYKLTGVEGFTSPSLRKDVLHIHDRVFQAIRNRDMEAAQRRMRRHIEGYVSRYEEWSAEQRDPDVS